MTLNNWSKMVGPLVKADSNTRFKTAPRLLMTEYKPISFQMSALAFMF